MRVPLPFINPLRRHRMISVLQHPSRTLHPSIYSPRYYVMASSSDLSISTTVKLSSGYTMPILGLGVFQNPGASVVSACLAATEAGYRHIDSAQFYANEKEVAKAVMTSGLKREELFVSESCQLCLPSLSIVHGSECIPDFLLPLATKILSRNYASVPASVSRSVQQFATHDNDEFKFGYIDLLLIHDPNCGPSGRLTMWKDFLKARDDGWVRSVGVSNLCVRFLYQDLCRILTRFAPAVLATSRRLPMRGSSYQP
jgi:aryl-alcohol dehydrogenase-like predicted oxidoreductase